MPDIVYPGLKKDWEARLAQVEVELQGFDRARATYFEEGVAMLEFASNTFSTFKTASNERKREMAKNLLSNSTITDGKVQVSFDKAFEMILEANLEMTEDTPKSDVLRKWLPD